MQLTFLGATGTVTGSKYLVESGGARVLVDCGLFQGVKQLRLRNRAPLPFDVRSLDAVVLTHAHLDHSGYLPLLVRDGFAGPVYCTGATRALCGILLPDSGHLQEEEAEYANRHGFSRHHPALPLYTEADAVRSLAQLVAVEFGAAQPVAGGLGFQLYRAGHLLGAAMVHLHDAHTDVLFSGDLGRPHDVMLPPPEIVRTASHLVVESTYGDRLHRRDDPADALADAIVRTARRGGSVVIPSFAVGRAQVLLLLLHRLKRAGRIPDIPVFLDSPMAARATAAFARFHAEHLLDEEAYAAVRSGATVVESVEQSKAIDRMHVPRIILSASGMATGGRVLHHLKALAPDARNTVLFAGHQAVGTRGGAIVGGARAIKIHGAYVQVNAEVAVLDNVSAHADHAEILDWLRHFDAPPRQTYVTHGEPVAADAMRRHIEETLGWSCSVPEYRESVVLPAEVPRPLPARAAATHS
jgi:metallo-beta-lactamase family protein